MPGNEEEIVIRAILEDELSDPADRVRRALDEIGRSNREAADDTDSLTGAQNRNADAQENNRRETDRSTDARRSNSRATSDNTRSTDDNTDSQRQNTRERSRSNKSAKDSSKIFSKLSKLMMPVGKAMLMLDAAATAAPGIMALGAAGVSAGAGLSVLSGAMLPLPSLFAGVGQAMGVMKLATSGMGDAVKALASGDMTKFAEATKDMHPNAIAAAQAIGGLGEKFKDIKKDVQGAVFKGLSADLTAIGTKVLPIVRGSFTGTAEGINTGIKTMTNFIKTSQGLSQVRSIMNGTSAISQDFAKAMGHAGVGMIGLMNATMPIARQMSADLRDGVIWLSNAIQQNQGKIQAFAQRGYDLFRRMIGVIVDLGKGIFNIGRQSMGLAGSMGKGIEGMAAKFRAWTNSVEGQNKIAQVFENAKPVLAAVARLVGVVSTEFGKLATNAGSNQNLVMLIDKLAGMVPILADIAGQASGKFLPSLLKIAEAVLQIVEGMDAMGPTAILMQSIAEPTATLADAFTALPGPIQQTIGYLTMFALAAKAAAGTTAGAWLLQTAFVQTRLGALRGALAMTALAMKGFAIDAARAAASSAIGTKLTAAWGAVTRAIVAARTAMMSFAASTMTFLFTNPIGWIILAVIALVAVFVILWKKCEGFRNVVKAIGQWFVDVWNGTLFPMIMKVWDWIKDVWSRVYGFVKGVVMGIVNFFRSNWNTIKTIATLVWLGIKTTFMVLWRVVSTYVKIWIVIFRTVFNVIKTVVMTAFSIIKSIVMAVAPIFAAVFGIVKSIVSVAFVVIKVIFMVFLGVIKVGIFVIATVFKAVFAIVKAVFTVAFNVMKAVFLVWWGVVKMVFNALKTAWIFTWNIIKSVFMVVWGMIKAAIAAIMPYVTMVMNFVKMIFTTAWNIIKMVVSTVINIVIGIINRIIGVVSTVMNTVRSIWSGVWNTLSGIVSGVIGTISGIINRIRETVSSVTESVRNAFSSAFERIRSVVMPILENIKGFIDGIRDAAVSVLDKVSSIVDAIPGFAAGGTPIVGQMSMVGELGPEAFVTHTGKVSMIGTNGPEMRQFHTPGYVVPNHVLRGVPDSSVPRNVMAKLSAAMGGGEVDTGRAYDRPARGGNLSSNTYMQDQQGGGDHYDFRGANFGGDPSVTKQAIIQALSEVERNKRQRG